MNDSTHEVQPGLPRLAHALNRAVPIFGLWFMTVCAYIAIMVFLPDHSGAPAFAFLLIFVLYSLSLWIFNLFTLAQLALAQHVDRWAVIIGAVLLLHPLFCLVGGITLIIRARVRLRRAGASLGLFRIAGSEIERVSRLWCESCGYSREGLAEGAACPECGLWTGLVTAGSLPVDPGTQS